MKVGQILCVFNLLLIGATRIFGIFCSNSRYLIVRFMMKGNFYSLSKSFGEINHIFYSYTSLGSMENTYPNPELKDDTQPSGFKHACRLTNELHERDGRQGSSKK